MCSRCKGFPSSCLQLRQNKTSLTGKQNQTKISHSFHLNFKYLFFSLDAKSLAGVEDTFIRAEKKSNSFAEISAVDT